MRAMVLILAVGLAGCGYNDMVTLREDIDSAWGQVDKELQRRSDLVPNLMSVTRGYATHEQQVFQAVADARARLLASESRTDRIDAATAMSSALGRLLALAESYPTLKADAQFQRLLKELADIEDRIAVERTRYNDAVRAYNSFVQGFPRMIYASALGFTPQRYFEASAAARATPRVDLPGTGTAIR